jgi:hypothetical protein
MVVDWPCGKLAVSMAGGSRPCNAYVRKLSVFLAVGAKHQHFLLITILAHSTGRPLDGSLWLVALGGRLDVDVKYLSIFTL